MDPVTLDPRLQVALFTASVTVILWGLKQILDAVVAWRARRRSRDQLVRALYAEVRFNVAELTDAAANGVKIGDIREAMEHRQGTIPHMTDARHDAIWQSRLTELPLLDDALIGSLIRFYGRMEKIHVQIAGLNLPSYATISTNGKLKVMDRINVQIAAARDDGVLVLDDLEAHYPKILAAQAQLRHGNRLSASFGSDDDGVGTG